MMKTMRKRASAFVVSAVMAASSLSVLTSGSLPVLAATSASAINKTLATAVNSEDPDHPANETDCTFMCKEKTDEWTTFTDTTGVGPATFLGTEEVTTLKFNFKSEEYVTQFSYYFGCAADKAHAYWWDYKDPQTDEAYECHPYAKEFSIVIEIPSYANFADTDGKFQIQNCYAATINEETKKSTQKADIVLTSIEANAPKSDDTSEGEPLDWIPKAPNPDLPKGAENTGGLNYSSANGAAESYSFKENGDGTATVTALNSLKLEGLDILLTPGDTCSEDYYADHPELLPNSDGKPSEESIRNAGLPLNSHKFTYADFNFTPGINVPSNAKVKSLSVTLKAESDTVDVTRLMYGGGMNVTYKSLADTEYTKYLCGVKEDPNAGYWYNDVGPEALAECNEAGADWGNGVGEFSVGGGTDLAKQSMGGYVTVTWDVPEQVLDCATFKAKDQMSFQLWYAEMTGEDGNVPLEGGLTIVSATLSYEESITFPYSGQASVTNAGSGKIPGDPVSVNYADFGMEYEKTADVYAVQFDVTLPSDANQVVVGAGTSVLERLGLTDNWYQSDDAFKSDAVESSSMLLYWEKTTAGSRPDAADTKLATNPYVDPTGTKTYTYMWIMPPKVAEGANLDPETGALKKAVNYINAEEESGHVSFGVWYAGLGSTTASTYSVDKVTVFYAADDKDNAVKGDKFEDTLSVVESVDVEIGGTAKLDINVPGCSIHSSNSNWASASLNDDGVSATIKGKNVTDPDDPVILTITTPGGQTAEVKVNVLAEVTEEPPKTTESSATTTESTTTTSSSQTTASTGETTDIDYKANALYGDVNLDGKVELTDAILLNKACAGTVNLTGQALENSDCEYDGVLNAGDALTLLKFLVQLIPSIGPEV